MKNINDNVIANRWKQRYAQQPDRIKEKLDELEKKELKDYQLQVIKRKEELLVILIFKESVELNNILYEDLKKLELLLPPKIVGKEYWSRGYFYNIAHSDKISNTIDYGFYSIGKGKYFDEYGNEIKFEPQLLGTYGVATVSGIARKINRELIIAGIL